MLSLDALAQEPARVATLSRPEAAKLYRQAARLEADLRALLLTTPAEPAAPPEELLSLDVAATRLGVKKSRLAEAARRGDVAVVMIGRYPRIRPSILAQLIDRGGLPTVTSGRDQARIPAAPNAARALAGAARRRHGHHQSVGVALGGGRAADRGAGRAVSEAPGPDAG